nr:hypothetical protein [uncultured Rhodopila sp.]
MLLLGLAVFGQPDAYLRMAREQWDSLVDISPDAPADLAQPNASVAATMAQLQQQVSQLRDELMNKRNEAERARQALAEAEAQRQASERQASERQASERQASERQASERQAVEQPPAAPAGDVVVVVPERHDVASAPPAVEHHEPPAPPERRAAARPPPAVLRPFPRQEADNAQSVLARLRQAAPSATADVPPQAERINRAPSPSLRRLIAARSALAGGQIEETRRLLQEAQLQLVFRPVGSTEDDPVPAGKAASDVAHALDALSGNDVALSRSYIDRAVDDTSGRAVEGPAHQEAPATPGYAPAYPLR